MLELPPDGLAVAAEVVRIASAPGRLEQRAEALLVALHRLVPFEAGWIALRGEGQEHIPVASQGYADPLTAFFETPEAIEELELIGMHRSRPPMCLRDLPVPPTELHSWADYLWPAGFREGVAVGLFSPDGRHLGYPCLLTDTDRHPTDAARDLIGTLTPMMATTVDPMRSITAVLQIIRDAEAGTVLTRAGNPLPLPGLPTHPLLTPGSAVLRTGWSVEAGEPKSDAGNRDVALDAATVGVLRAHRKRQREDRLAWRSAWVDSGRVFTREDGSELHPASVTDLFNDLVEAAGLPPIRLHDLRHGAATLAKAAGIDTKIISAMLGHSSRKITDDTYTSVFAEVAKDAAEATAAIVPRAVGDGQSSPRGLHLVSNEPKITTKKKPPTTRPQVGG